MNSVPERLLHALIGEVEIIASRPVIDRDELFELVAHYRNEAESWEERSEKKVSVESDLLVSSWENTVSPQDAAYNFLVDTIAQM